MVVPSMRAWRASNGRLSLSRSPRPVPGPEESLVAVCYSGVCGSDLAKLAQSPVPSGPSEPWIPGHEIVGYDTSSENGQLVVVNPLVPCDRCATCGVGHVHLCPDLKRIGWDLPGGFAEYLAVPRRNIVSLPATMAGVSAVLADPLAVAIHGLRCGLSGDMPTTIAIIGTGALGICTAAYAALRGYEVVIYGRDPRRFDQYADLIDANFAIFSDERNIRYDVVVDAASGHRDEPLRHALAMVRDGGTVLVQNAYHPGVRLDLDLRDIFRRSIRIVGSYSFCRGEGLDDFAEAVRVLRSNPAWAGAVTGRQVPMSDLVQVVRAYRSSSTRPAKTVLIAGAAGSSTNRPDRLDIERTP